MSPWALLSVFAWPMVLGVASLRFLRVERRDDPLAYWAWAWVTGALGTAAITFAWCWTGAPLTSLPFVVAAVACAALFLSIKWIDRPTEAFAPPPAARSLRVETAVYWTVTAVALVVVLLRIVDASRLAIVTDDEANLWALHAKVIFHAGGFTQAYREVVSSQPSLLLHADYPLFNPLLQLWTYAHSGAVEHVAARLPVQAVVLAGVVVLASALRRAVRPGVAAALLVMIVATPQLQHQPRVVNSDLMVAFGALIAFDAWTRWHAAQDTRSGNASWRLGCVGVALMLWSKNEGLFYLACVVGAWILLCLVTRKSSMRSWQAAWMLLPLGVILLGQGFNLAFGFENDLIAGKQVGEPFWVIAWRRLSEAGRIVYGFLGREVFFSTTHNHGLVAAFAVLTFLAARTAFGAVLRVPTLALWMALVGLSVVYLGTPHDGGSLDGVRWHLETSGRRVFFQLVPCLALWVAHYLGILAPWMLSNSESSSATPGTP